jgi:hypothetical protein
MNRIYEIEEFQDPTEHLETLGNGHGQLRTGGGRGIRTLDTLPYTRFPIVRLRPLGHPSLRDDERLLNSCYFDKVFY